MRPATPKPVRRAYLIAAAIMTMAILMSVQAVLARCMLLEFQRDRQAALRVCAGQIFASARAWSDRHADQIAGEVPTPLALKELLPAGVEGRATLQRVPATTGDELIECEVTLSWARTRLRQIMHWPLSGVATPEP